MRTWTVPLHELTGPEFPSDGVNWWDAAHPLHSTATGDGEPDPGIANTASQAKEANKLLDRTRMMGFFRPGSVGAPQVRTAF